MDTALSTDLFAVISFSLNRHSRREEAGRWRPRLRQARLEDVLWQLRGLATARLADEDKGGVVPDQSYQLAASFRNWQALLHHGTPGRACLHHAKLLGMAHLTPSRDSG